MSDHGNGEPVAFCRSKSNTGAVSRICGIWWRNRRSSTVEDELSITIDYSGILRRNRGVREH